MALFPRSGPVTQGQRLSNNLRTQAAGSGDGLTIVTRHVRDQKPTPQQPPPVSGGGGPTAQGIYTDPNSHTSSADWWVQPVNLANDIGGIGSYASYSSGAKGFLFGADCWVQVAASMYCDQMGVGDPCNVQVNCSPATAHFAGGTPLAASEFQGTAANASTGPGGCFPTIATQLFRVSSGDTLNVQVFFLNYGGGSPVPYIDANATITLNVWA